MLTLKHFLKAEEQNRQYGVSGRHYTRRGNPLLFIPRSPKKDSGKKP